VKAPATLADSPPATSLARKTSGYDIKFAVRGARAAQEVGGGRAPEGAMSSVDDLPDWKYKRSGEGNARNHDVSRAAFCKLLHVRRDIVMLNGSVRSFFLLLVAFFGAALTSVVAQDFEITKYEVAATLKAATNTADVTATLRLVNRTTQGRAATKLTLNLTKAAKVTSWTVGGATAQAAEDKRATPVATYVFDLPTPIQPNETLTTVMQYSLTFKESTNHGAITPGDAVILPEANWVPFVHAPQQAHGADTAPYTLTVTNSDPGEVMSDGVRTVSGNVTTFDQALAGQPWFAMNFFGKPTTREFTPSGGSMTTVAVVTQPGLSAIADAQARRIAEEMEKIVDFCAKVFGPPPAKRFTVFSTPRNLVIDKRSPELRGRDFDTVNALSYVAPTTVMIGQSVFRRPALDAETVEFLAQGVARAWLGGKTKLRGRGLGALQDGFPAYLAGLYFESRFGADAAREYWTRRAQAYAPMAAARIDAILIAQSPVDPDYGVSMPNKGAMVFRLLERRIGRERTLDTVKKLCADGADASLEKFRSLAGAASDATLASFFKQWFDELSEPDFIVGVPQKNESGGWTCALRNLGTGDAEVPVIATTDKGETLQATTAIPSKGYSQVEFKTAANIVRVEVDPEKLYPQTRFPLDPNSKQFDNDARPERPFYYTLFLEAEKLIGKRKFAEAEVKLRECVAQSPNFALGRAMLARTLAASGKSDAAQTEASQALKTTPTPVYALGVAALTEGDAALARKNYGAAREAYQRAVNVDASPELDGAARRGLLAAEAESGAAAAIDEEVKKVIGLIDRAIRTGTTNAMEERIIRADLPKFVLGIVVSKPDAWTTQPLRVEKLDDYRVAVDVKIDVVTATKEEQVGTGVFVLRRIGSELMLEKLAQFALEKKK
jgi:hypothetical protein